MKKPIAVGDLCRVINGYHGKDSPNIGLIVRVVRFLTDEFVEKLFRCESEYSERTDRRITVSKAPAGYADYFESWLERIEPDVPEKQLTIETTKETT